MRFALILLGLCVAAVNAIPVREPSVESFVKVDEEVTDCLSSRLASVDIVIDLAANISRMISREKLAELINFKPEDLADPNEAARVIAREVADFVDKLADGLPAGRVTAVLQEANGLKHFVTGESREVQFGQSVINYRQKRQCCGIPMFCPTPCAPPPPPPMPCPQTCCQAPICPPLPPMCPPPPCALPPPPPPPPIICPQTCCRRQVCAPVPPPCPPRPVCPPPPPPMPVCPRTCCQAPMCPPVPPMCPPPPCPSPPTFNLVLQAQPLCPQTCCQAPICPPLPPACPPPPCPLPPPIMIPIPAPMPCPQVQSCCAQPMCPPPMPMCPPPPPCFAPQPIIIPVPAPPPCPCQIPMCGCGRRKRSADNVEGGIGDLVFAALSDRIAGRSLYYPTGHSNPNATFTVVVTDSLQSPGAPSYTDKPNTFILDLAGLNMARNSAPVDVDSLQSLARAMRLMTCHATKVPPASYRLVEKPSSDLSIE